jgi:hypothetical protein
MTDEEKLERFVGKLDAIGYDCYSKEDQGIYTIALILKMRELMHLNLTKEQRLSIVIGLLNEENNDG